MDKEQFNNSDIKEQVKYFNEKIKELGSSSAASRDIGYKDESTIRKRFKGKGYRLNEEKTEYVLVDNTAVSKADTSKTIITSKSETKVLNKNIPENLVKEIEEFKSLKNDIKEMLEWRENFKEVAATYEDTEIKIDAQRLKNEDAITRGIKIYPSVFIEFKKFCTEHKEYRMQDLISMALLEYIRNHS